MLRGAISPMLWAFGCRARLLLPQELWLRLSAQQQSALLAHELAHWRRRDHWVRYVELAATVLYWWHPLIWWGRLRLREAEEQCCDAWVVWAWPDGARSYAAALVEAVDFVSAAGARPMLGSGIGYVQHLMSRVRMIMRAGTPRALSGTWRVAMLSMAAMLLPLAAKLASAEGEKDRPEQDRQAQRDEDRPREEGRERRAPREDRVARDKEIRGEKGEKPRAAEERGREGENRDRPREADRPDIRRGREGDEPAEGPRLPRQTRPVGGIVSKIEDGALILLVGDGQREIAVPIEDDTEVFVDGAKARLEDLKGGYRAVVYQREGLTRRIEARVPPTIRRRDGGGRE